MVPLACCGGPPLIAILAAAGALARGAFGLGAGLLAAVTFLVIATGAAGPSAEVAARESARSYDAPGARYTHRDGKCSFDVLVVAGQRRAAGKVMVNRAPAPGPSLAAVMVPSWAVIRARAMVRPIPEPPWARSRPGSAR